MNDLHAMPPTTRSKSITAQSTTSQSSINNDQRPAASIELELLSTHTSNHSLGSAPPTYTIDLSLPPSERYVHVVKEYKHTIQDLTELFDELLSDAKLPKSLFHFIARFGLRKLHSKEQTEELRGIKKVTGLPMYLLVAYNVLLDLFMGCSSGGVLTKEPQEKAQRMMHYRTLDWGMPSLRKAVVQYEFKSSPNGDIVARTIGYVGHVGVLTAVKKGLSMSLNCRPYHNNDHSKRSNAKFYGHILLVLLGFRPSICAHLRDLFIPRAEKRSRRWTKRSKTADGSLDKSQLSKGLADIASKLPSVPTTAAYLTFCDGAQTLILEKDLITAKILTSSSFIAVTNHDTSYESSGDSKAQHKAYIRTHQCGMDMEYILSESISRKDCIAQKWEDQCAERKSKRKERQEKEGVDLETLKEWLLEYPVSNDQTHFSCIMDPEKGIFPWVRSFEEGEIEYPYDSEDDDGYEFESEEDEELPEA